VVFRQSRRVAAGVKNKFRPTTIMPGRHRPACACPRPPTTAALITKQTFNVTAGAHGSERPGATLCHGIDFTGLGGP